MSPLQSLSAVLLALSATVLARTQFPDCVKGPLANNTVCNPRASPSERAAALVAALRIDEKLVNLVDKSLGAPRLGLAPYYWWSEALHGVGYSPGVSWNYNGSEFSAATSFPSPILLSAAFDDDLVQEVATVISTEARAFSNAGRAGLDFWTPNINPFKDPRWGRGQETPGEDPFRIKGYIRSLIPGLQGGHDPEIKKVIATCKHFAAYDLEKWSGTTRFNFDAKVSTQELVEYYLPPFQQCARDSNVGSVMCSYNSVNGVPACASSYLMNTVLREHWGWTKENQYITSDCNAVENIYMPKDHNYTKTAAQAAGLAYTAGMDNVCEGDRPTDVIGAYNGSYLSTATIDRALKRQYEGLVRLGFFDPDGNSTAYRKLSWKDVNTPHAQELVRSSASDSLVLLKNDGTLPLKLKPNASVAVIGFWAWAPGKLIGNYQGIPPYARTPVDAAVARGLKVNWAAGPTNQSTDSMNYTMAALSAARNSDYILYFGGIDTTVENEERDRYQIGWPGAQRHLISQLAALKKPLVVVQLGTGLDNAPLLNNTGVNSILWAGYPGQDGGSAVFDVLTGQKAPAGRLPITVYPERYVNEVPMTEMSLRPSAKSPGRTYKFYKNAVHEFGYGMHYTNFTAKFRKLSQGAFQTPVYSIGSLTATFEKTLLDLLPGPSVDISVTNTGSKVSDFVALLFVSHQNGPAPYPLKELVGYKRLRNIAPNSTIDTQITLQLGDLARVDSLGNTVIYPGNYTLLLDVPTQDSTMFVLSGQQRVLDKWPTAPWDVNSTMTSTTPMTAAVNEEGVVLRPGKIRH